MMRQLLVICILLMVNLYSLSKPVKTYTVKGYYMPSHILTRYPYSCSDVKKNRHVYYENKITQEELMNIQSKLDQLKLAKENMTISNYRQIVEIIDWNESVLTICFDVDGIISVNDRTYIYDKEVYNYFFKRYDKM